MTPKTLGQFALVLQATVAEGVGEGLTTTITANMAGKDAPAWRRTFTLRGLHQLPAVWH